MEKAQEGQSDLVVSGSAAAHLLEVVEHPFDAVATPITSQFVFLESLAAFA